MAKYEKSNPVLCVRDDTESSVARTLLDRAEIPYDLWDATKVDTDWQTPFVSFARNVYSGVDEIRDRFLEDYHEILRAEHVIYGQRGK